MLEWELLAFPCRVGDLNIPNPTTLCELQLSALKKISGPLASLILEQANDFSIPSLRSIKTEICQTRHWLLTSNFNGIKSCLDPTLQRNIDLLAPLFGLQLFQFRKNFHLNEWDF